MAFLPGSDAGVGGFTLQCVFGEDVFKTVLGFWVQGLWLVWSFQGERTLSHFMKQKGFPANVAPHILPAEVSILPLTSAFCLSL